MGNLGILRVIDPRTAWPDEARDFTPWLANNIQMLGEALGLDLVVDKREADVGDFSLDLLARDLSTGHTVVIENQLTATDHDHLGKLLTYAGGFDASVAVWITKEMRDEHRKALEWLNERTGVNTHFFGIVIELLQIDDSKPAPNFRVVVLPNNWEKITDPPQELTEREKRYRSYFQGLIDELRDVHQFTGAKVGQPQNWYSFSSGHPEFYYSTSFANNKRIRSEVYLDCGDTEENKENFDSLFAKRELVEQLFGEELVWERLDNRRASRIALYRSGSIDDESALSVIKAWMIEKLLRFKAVFGDGFESLISRESIERS